MDPRIPRLHRKLASLPFQLQRSHSFGEEHHKYRLGPKLSQARIAAFEAEHRIELPTAYRQFLLHLGGTGAAPFYGLIALETCSLHTMDPRKPAGGPRGFSPARNRDEGDLFLRIIEMGCTDMCLLAITGPLTGRVLTGNAEGSWGPDVSSAADFLSWYERWLDHIHAGKDNRALELTSPQLRVTRADIAWRRHSENSP
ncbi:SMI1/KNR4 family protein [Streptosporangium sp. G11]|uniref:SMI1/KNR4 family protein n=1 Tax=Streptosporangium sp. G11 TaxID=3436926 RepID=UPI003EB69B64